ncbi:extracellular solute-binding protein [Actinomadura sp. GTD37]|uniref:extracellular solute-binding protein n=1 Tax=Actinomadura sp. GTD37 TaxID=1778030 RepID=UPI0035C170F8
MARDGLRRFLPPDATAWGAAAAGACLILVIAVVVALRPGPSRPHCDRENLVVVGGTDVSLNYQRRKLIQDWNKKNPLRKATLVEVADSTDLQHSQIKAVEESGGCDYDVLIMDNTWTAQFASSGYLRPLDDINEGEDFFGLALQTGAWEGVQYAVPFNVDVGLLYFRKGAKVPAAWPDLLDSGVAMQFGDYEGRTVNALEAVWNGGGAGLLSGDGHPGRADLRKRVFPALVWLAKRLVRLAKRQPQLVAASREAKEQDSIQAFVSGTSRMRNWPYAFSALATDPRMRNGDELNFGVRELPGDGVLGGQNLAVSAYSPHPEDAVKLVNFLSDKDSQIKLFSCGGFAPARHSALGLRPGDLSPSAVSVAPCDLGRDKGEAEESFLPSQAQLTTLGRAIVGALPRAQSRPVTPHYSTFSATFRDCVEKIFRGEESKPQNDARVDAASFARAVDQSLDGRTASC